MKKRECHGKYREVMDSRESGTIGNIEHSGRERRAAVPAGLPVPVSPPEVLGEPLAIKQVAELIGCSAWTVRQKYVPSGLPHFRLGPNAKLIFYKNQIIRWLLTQQQKGGQVV